VQVAAPAIALGLAILGTIRAWRRFPLEALLLVVPVVGTTGVLFALRSFVAGRFLSFLVIPLLILVAEATATLYELGRGRPRLQAGINLAFVTVGVILTLSFVVHTRPVVLLPRENFKEMAAAVQAYPSWPVVSNSTRNTGIAYYVDREVEFITNDDALQSRLCRPGPFIFIHHPLKAPKVDLQCLDRSGVRKERFKQRARGFWIDVWIVER